MRYKRFLFRMTYYKNLTRFFSDGCEFARNHHKAVRGYSISYDNIAERRGTSRFTTPCDSNVNDFVPFYFSPSTKMAFAIHRGNVVLKDPEENELGSIDMNDVVYMIVDPEILFNSGRDFWYTNISCNSAVSPCYHNNREELSKTVNWALFDEDPKMGSIPEIGYDGVCQYQHDRDQPGYSMRSKERMAEFMVRDYLQMSELRCIVLKDRRHQEEVQALVNGSGINIPVLIKPGCYF